MQIFSFLYKKVLGWAYHPFAVGYLAVLSFAESSFFPVPPDVMLMPMCLAQPKKAWRYATIATFFSILGGCFGYLLGLFFSQFITPYIQQLGYGEAYQQVHVWFTNWGWWVILLAGFSPIPYKLFTFGAGAIHMPLLPFILASIIGRGMRFYLVAGLLYWKGRSLQNVLERYVDIIGWITVILFLIACCIYYVLK